MSSLDADTRYIQHPTPQPHGETEWKEVYDAIQKSLVSSIQRVERESSRGPIDSRDSVYTGLAGISLMLYHLASTPSLSFGKDVLKAERLRKQADKQLYAVIHQNRVPPSVKEGGYASFLETPIGTATLVLYRCVESLSYPPYSEDERMLGALRRHWTNSASLMLGTIKRIVAEDEDKEWFDEDSSEVLYGRAGFLYAILFLRKAAERARDGGYLKLLDKEKQEDIGRITKDSSLRRVVQSIIARGKLGAQRYVQEFGPSVGQDHLFPTLMWKWHGKKYLGGAHGIFGILQMLLSCPKSVIENYTTDILSTVQWVVSSQDMEGNWPTKAMSRWDQRDASLESNELVQWCHGAPGAVILLSTTLRRSSDPYSFWELNPDFRTQMEGSLRRGADIVYQRGLLRKGVGLCHGVGGSVYALLAASSSLDSPTNTPYLKKAIHLAHLGTLADSLVQEGSMNIPDHPWSLYEGLAGMCCAWGDILSSVAEPDRRQVSGSRMPGYDDLF